MDDKDTSLNNNLEDKGADSYTYEQPLTTHVESNVGANSLTQASPLLAPLPFSHSRKAMNDWLIEPPEGSPTEKSKSVSSKLRRSIGLTFLIVLAGWFLALVSIYLYSFTQSDIHSPCPGRCFVNFSPRGAVYVLLIIFSLPSLIFTLLFWFLQISLHGLILSRLGLLFGSKRSFSAIALDFAWTTRLITFATLGYTIFVLIGSATYQMSISYALDIFKIGAPLFFLGSLSWVVYRLRDIPIGKRIIIFFGDIFIYVLSTAIIWLNFFTFIQKWI